MKHFNGVTTVPVMKPVEVMSEEDEAVLSKKKALAKLAELLEYENAS